MEADSFSFLYDQLWGGYTLMCYTFWLGWTRPTTQNYTQAPPRTPPWLIYKAKDAKAYMSFGEDL